MKKSILFAALAAITLSASSCYVRINDTSSLFKFNGSTLEASDNVVSEDRALLPFDEIILKDSFDAEFIESDSSPYATVTTSDNLMAYVKTKVEDGVLLLEFGNDSITSYHGSVHISVYGKNLKEISIIGSGDFSAERITSTDDLSVSIAGSGDVALGKVQCEDYECSIAGSGEMVSERLNAESASLSIAGSGDISARNVYVKDIKVSISGSGSATLAGEAEVARYEIAGSGDVYVRGFKAASTSSRISGSGEVHE